MNDDALDLSLSFPPHPPHRLRRAATAEDLTTEFILRTLAFDRGGLFPAYAMHFETLGQLEPARLTAILPALLGDDDEQVSRVAWRAIEHMPGTTFVDVLLTELMNGKPWAWSALVVENDAGATGVRLGALVDLAMKAPNEWSRYEFWRILEREKCFDAAVIARALDRLAEAEKKRPARSEPPPIEADALREYLDAARADRTKKKPSPPPTAAQYRKWFEEHPAVRPRDR